MYNQYQKTQVTTASPEKILIMLYDGAIRFAKIALGRLENRDMAGKGVNIGKAMAIVSELQSTLNHDVGGEIAGNLERLYVYLTEEFTKFNMNNSPAHLENAIKILTVLRDTWVEAAEIVRKEKEAGQNEYSKIKAVAG
jgi:flagellar protein FliS